MHTQIRRKIFKANKAMEKLYAKVVKYVQARGEYIDTQNAKRECDPIYAYKINDDDTVEEYNVFGVRVIDGELQIALEHRYNNQYWDAYEFEQRDWECAAPNSDSILYAQTLLSIADSIEEY